MASKEIESSVVVKNVKSAPCPDSAKQCLDVASELLLFRHFEECIQACERGIVKAKLENNGYNNYNN